MMIWKFSFFIMINLELVGAIVDKWDTKSRVFRFGTIKLCPIIDEYARLIGVPRDCEKVIIPCLTRALNKGY